jgi:hypothetical protein
MPDAVNPNGLGTVVDLIENAIDTHSNPPVVLAANQFPAAARPRLFGELPDRSDQARSKRRWQPIQILLGVSLEKDLCTGLGLALRQIFFERAILQFSTSLL